MENQMLSPWWLDPLLILPIVQIFIIVVTVISLVGWIRSRKLIKILNGLLDKSYEKNNKLVADDNARPMLKAELTQGKRGKYRYTVRNRSGEAVTVAPVSGYTSESEAKDAINLISNAKISL